MQLKKPFDGNYPITQKYGEKYTNEAGHNGIDYALPEGTPVLAACDGTIVKASTTSDGYGNCIILQPAGEVTGVLYGHLSSFKRLMGALGCFGVTNNPTSKSNF